MRDTLPISERLYGMLLYLYPKRFRATYGQQMRLTFRDACRNAYRQDGAGGLLVLWLPTLLDLFKSALEAQTRQGEIIMSKARLRGLAGPLSIIVGALWILSALGEAAFQIKALRNEALLVLWIVPLFLAFVPMLFAIIGSRLRFHESASGLGKVGLAMSVVGCAGVLVFMLLGPLLGLVLSESSQLSWVNYMAMVCILSIKIGYLLFGVDALQHRLLPRWNLLPLLLGLTLVFSFPMQWFGAPALVPSQWTIPVLHSALSGACWLLLGIAMLEPKRELHTATVV